MSDVFVSYKRVDETRVAALVDALQAGGLSVWWDRDIEAGAHWRQAIGERLEAARCVIVVWSAASVGADASFVHDEAARARARGCLLPVSIDPVVPPLGFGEIQSLSLVGWQGDAPDPRCLAVVAAARALTEGRRPSGLTPLQRRRLAPLRALAVGALGLLLALALALDVAGVRSSMCGAAVLQTACRWLGIPGAPDPEDAALWASRAVGDCDGLRRYLARFPAGPHAEEAARRLAAVQTSVDTAWETRQLRLPLTVRAAPLPLATRDAARADAQRRAPEDAELACGGLRSSDNRLTTVGFSVARWECRPRGAGHACAFDGEALCTIEAPRRTTRNFCP